MRHISARDNPFYRQLQGLGMGRSPKGTHQVLIEGTHLCQAWFDRFGAPLVAVFDQALLDAQRQPPRWLDLPQDHCISLDSRLVRGLSQVIHGPGIFFVVEPPRPTLPERIDQACIWLDRIQDPGNLGTLLRTAAAAGIRQAYLSAGCATAWSPKVLRSGQGAHFALEIHEHIDLYTLTPRLAIALAVTTLDDASELFSTDLRAPCAWVFGNEGQGVDERLQALAAVRVWIPQAEAVESLNVAAAAAICLFEQRRQQNVSLAPQSPNP
ncbi:RNA methyltransferase [Alcaligenaceae bacterium CGII-47]|nr:RNA methyltransferase [Alcaligenaceae bacterium CGII-47]